MSQPWTYLLSRYGGESSSPSSEQLRQAVSELFNENIPALTQADYEEHGESSLRHGYDEGPMYVLSITRKNVASLEVWKDQDYEEEACPVRSIPNITSERAFELWYQLAQGKITQIEIAFNAVA